MLDGIPVTDFIFGEATNYNVSICLNCTTDAKEKIESQRGNHSSYKNSEAPTAGTGEASDSPETKR
ncbi:hypothetical protein [Providencia sp. PROV111]|uniref:hypothetical protein n=1 Tax=Providencia sp. PROV111 TaxID=2949822 RepID=UPI00234B80E5|nr:hypothetical protein [Providencia sp. PROV111]